MLINLYGGPGTGKSTIAAGLFHCINTSNLPNTSSELVTEYAKDLTWENRSQTLAYQFYVDAKQYRNLRRVVDAGVDFVVTDSPMMKGSYYASRYCPQFPQSYHDTLSYFDKELGPAMNFFLRRSVRYVTLGRNEPAEVVAEMDYGIENMLIDQYGKDGYHSVFAGADTHLDIWDIVVNGK